MDHNSDQTPIVIEGATNSVRVQFSWPTITSVKRIQGVAAKIVISESGRGVYAPPVILRVSEDDFAANTVRDDLAKIMNTFPVRSWKVFSEESFRNAHKNSGFQRQERFVKEILREFYVRPGARIGTFVTILNPSRYKRTPGTRGVGLAENDPYWQSPLNKTEI